jgi:DNA-binding Xre family transcriptional regulator
MTDDLDYEWHLREVMAERGLFSTAALRPLLAARGVGLSPSQVYRLVLDKPERLNLRTLMALLDILDCAMNDLIEPVSARRAGGVTRPSPRTRPGPH